MGPAYTSSRGTLSGRQRDCGARPPFPAVIPCGNRAAASGRTGSSPGLKSARMLRKYLEGESSAAVLFGCRLSEASGG